MGTYGCVCVYIIYIYIYVYTYIYIYIHILTYKPADKHRPTGLHAYLASQPPPDRPTGRTPLGKGLSLGFRVFPFGFRV